MDRYEVLTGVAIVPEVWTFEVEIAHDDPVNRELTVELIDPDGESWTLSTENLKSVEAIAMNEVRIIPRTSDPTQLRHQVHEVHQRGQLVGYIYRLAGRWHVLEDAGATEYHSRDAAVQALVNESP